MREPQPNASRYNVCFSTKWQSALFSPTLSNDTVHPLRNKVAEEAESDEASGNAPEPVEVLNVLAGDETIAN